MDYDLLILYSGGVDSLYCLHTALQSGFNPFILMIDYDQLHIAELDKAKAYLKTVNMLHHSQTVSIKNLNINSGLTNGQKDLYENEHEMYVPSRNMMFVSIAASIAESKNISLIWYGADLSDHENNFSDCKQEWMIRMNQLLQINGSKPIKLESPTIGLSKSTIASSVLKMIGDYNYKEYVYSGYGEFA
jgi:7-cyano-7-deazaguanine synthase